MNVFRHSKALGLTALCALILATGCNEATPSTDSSSISQTPNSMARGIPEGDVSSASQGAPEESVSSQESSSASASTITLQVNAAAEEQSQPTVATLTTYGDYNQLASSLSQLMQDADVVAKVRVEKATAFINEQGMIQTEIVPQVEQVFKGSLDGQNLYVNGGQMSYEEYIANETIQKAVEGHEAPEGEEQPQLVQQVVDGQYLVQEGQEYLFFAKLRPDSGKLYSLYAYQGTFLIEGDVAENAALDSEEPLAQQLTEQFGLTARSSGVEIPLAQLEEALQQG